MDNERESSGSIAAQGVVAQTALRWFSSTPAQRWVEKEPGGGQGFSEAACGRAVVMAQTTAMYKTSPSSRADMRQEKAT